MLLLSPAAVMVLSVLSALKRAPSCVYFFDSKYTVASFTASVGGPFSHSIAGSINKEMLSAFEVTATLVIPLPSQAESEDTG